MANAAIEFQEDEEVLELDTRDTERPEEEEPIIYDEDDPNLVFALAETKQGKEALKKLSDFVLTNFDLAWEASEAYRKRMADDWKLFAGELPPKPWPYEGCANAHVPIMMETISRLSTRAYGEVFGNWDNVFNVMPVGPEDNIVAEVMTKHDNWQLRNQITDFPRQMHRGILAFFGIGDVTCHSYYDEEKEVNRHEILMPDEFVIPWVTTVQPDYSDCPFIAKVMHKQRHQLQALREDWYGVDEVIKRARPSYDDEPDQEMNETVAEIQGIDRPEESAYAPYKLIWFEGWLELPNQERDRYCLCIIDKHTRGILKLSIHEEPDWRDKRRFERQNAERDAYLMALQQHQALVMQMGQEYEAVNADLDLAQDNMEAARAGGELGELQTALVSEKVEAMRPPPPEPPPEPPPPPWLMDPDQTEMADGEELPMPKPVKRVPIHLFAHGVCIEPLVGPLGLSYGRIEADFNRAANTALSQFTDAATQGNVRAFLASENVNLPENMTIAPGKVIRVTGVAPGELSNSIMPLDNGQANPQLLQIVEMMSQMGQSAIQAPNILSGEPGKSGETFRGQQGRMEAATKQLSVVTGKFVDFLKQIAKNNGTLNSIYLPEDQVVEVTNNITKMAEPLRVSRRMWERNYMVEFRADLRFASTATRVAEADNLMQMGMSLPFLQGNYAFLHAAAKAMLEARGKNEYLPLLGKPPPAPQMFGVPTSPPAPPPMPPGMGPPPGTPPGPGGPAGPGGPPGAGGAGAPAPPSPGGQRMGPPAPGPANS